MLLTRIQVLEYILKNEEKQKMAEVGKHLGGTSMESILLLCWNNTFRKLLKYFMKFWLNL